MLVRGAKTMPLNAQFDMKGFVDLANGLFGSGQFRVSLSSGIGLSFARYKRKLNISFPGSELKTKTRTKF